MVMNAFSSMFQSQLALYYDSFIVSDYLQVIQVEGLLL
jgi:hypothetical protein